MRAELRPPVAPGLSSYSEELTAKSSYDCRLGNFDWLTLVSKVLYNSQHKRFRDNTVESGQDLKNGKAGDGIVEIRANPRSSRRNYYIPYVSVEGFKDKT